MCNITHNYKFIIKFIYLRSSQIDSNNINNIIIYSNNNRFILIKLYYLSIYSI